MTFSHGPDEGSLSAKSGPQAKSLELLLYCQFSSKVDLNDDTIF